MMLWERAYVEWVGIWGRNANKKIASRDMIGQRKEGTDTETIEAFLVKIPPVGQDSS